MVLRRLLYVVIIFAITGCYHYKKMTVSAQKWAKLHDIDDFISNSIRDLKARGVEKVGILSEFKYGYTYILIISTEGDDSLRVDKFVFKEENGSLFSKKQFGFAHDDARIIGSIFSTEFINSSIPRSCHSNKKHNYLIEFKLISSNGIFSRSFESSCVNYLKQTGGPFQSILMLLDLNRDNL
jgi:hypothetical protein